MVLHPLVARLAVGAALAAFVISGGPGVAVAVASVPPASVFTVDPSVDNDGDGIPDEADQCPFEAGLPEYNGCPYTGPGDSDGDGITDDVDGCPGEAGPPEYNGCPYTGPGDSDGDGITDDVDGCPGEAGLPEYNGCPYTGPYDSDGDGVSDGSDQCPSEAGSPSYNGCPVPDSDNDGLPDDVDACPDLPGPYDGCPLTDLDGDGVYDDGADLCPNDPGLPEYQGCPAPDGDGDGIPDPNDGCPGEAGPPEYNGCPYTGPGDSDGDGITDDVDACPGEAGLPEYNGCPYTGPGDFDGDGVTDDVDQLPERGRVFRSTTAALLPTRTATASPRDHYRHPAETLAFFGVKPTDTVVEIWPGGGWYTEILAPYLARAGASYRSPRPMGPRRDRHKAANANPRPMARSPSPISRLFGGNAAAFPPAAPTSSSPSATSTTGGWAMARRQADYARRLPADLRDAQARRRARRSRITACPKAPTPSAREQRLYQASTVVASPSRPASSSPAQSEINANPKDTADWPKGVWTLPPTSPEGRGPRQICRDRRERPDDAEVRQAEIGGSERASRRPAYAGRSRPRPRPGRTPSSKSRSASDRSRVPDVEMSMARNWSHPFHASCSIVSSNANAPPSFQVRVSPPTRSCSPSGTISGRWMIVRTLLTPVWAGRWIPGGHQKKVVGARSGIWPAARLERLAVFGHRAHASSSVRRGFHRWSALQSRLWSRPTICCSASPAPSRHRAAIQQRRLANSSISPWIIWVLASIESSHGKCSRSKNSSAGQEREMQPRALVGVDLPATEHLIDAGVEAPALGRLARPPGQPRARRRLLAASPPLAATKARA